MSIEKSKIGDRKNTFHFVQLSSHLIPTYSLQAYSSLGSESHKSDLFADNKIQEMAKKYKCNVTDFLLAWSICQVKKIFL